MTLIGRTAWIADDSLITLRTALNLANGIGPGFNADETVQAYTHPLWFLVWLVIGSFTGEWILGIALFSFACTAGAIWIVLRQASAAWIIIASTSAFLFSNAFTEYSSSGLETPLAYLLLGTTLLLSKEIIESKQQPVWCFLLIGISWAAVILTRADLVLIILPIAAWILWRLRYDFLRLSASLVTLIAPLLIWYSWSFATYGSLLPNTFDAKRNLDIATGEQVFQGVRYIVLSLEKDPWTGFVLLLGSAIALTIGAAFQRASMVGVFLYLAYVAYVGGDFMSGRFLAVPTYVTIFIATTALSAKSASQPIASSVFTPSIARQLVISIALFIIFPVVILTSLRIDITALSNPSSQRWNFESNAGIADERGFSVEQGRSLANWYTTLGSQELTEGFQSTTGANPRLNIGDLRELAARWPVGPLSGRSTQYGIACGGLGSLGLSTGPEIHWIDPCGLTDSFLASLPYSAYNLHWRPGHFERALPSGYLQALQQGNPSYLEDPKLREQLRTIWERVRR